MSTPETPDRRPRAEFVGLSGYNFLAMVRRGFFYTFLMVFLVEKLGLPVTFVALTGALTALASTAGQLLVWGRYSDRTDRRAGVMVLGEIIAGLGYLITFAIFRPALAHLPPTAAAAICIACLAILELFWSMTDVGYRAAVAQVTTTANRGRYLGALDLLGLVGVGLGLYLGGLLYEDGAGYRNGNLWFLAAGFILAGAPLIRFTLWHLDGVRPEHEVAPAHHPLDRRFLGYMRVLCVAVLGLWSFQVVHTFFVRLPDTAAASDMGLSHIRTSFWIAGGLFAPVAGILVDRLGSRRMYALAVLACALVPLTFIPTRTVVYAAVTLGIFGAFLTTLRTASYALSAELAPPESRGRHFAVYNAVMSMGWGVAGLLIGGPVADLLHLAGQPLRISYAATFVTGSALGLIGLLLFLRFALGTKSK